MAHAAAGLLCVVLCRPCREFVIIGHRGQACLAAIAIEDCGKTVWIGRRNELFGRSLGVRVNPPKAAVGTVLNLVAVAPHPLAVEPDPLFHRLVLRTEKAAVAIKTNVAVMIRFVLLIGFPLSPAEIIRHMGNPGQP